MTKQTTQLVLKDAFHRELKVGDLVLGAKGRPNHYIGTVYMHAVVIGRTRAMVRLHQIDSFNICKGNVLQSIEGRYGRGGGKINPAEVILVDQGFLSEKEIEIATAKGVAACSVTVPASFLSTPMLTPVPSKRRTLSQQVFP